MTETRKLHSATAQALQQYNELISILGDTDIESVTILSDDPKQRRAFDLVYNLSSYLKKLEKHFHRSNLESIPVLEFSPAHASFINNKLIPSANKIRAVISGIFDVPILEESAAEEEETGAPERFKLALNTLLDFWVDTCTEGEKEQYVDFIYTCSELREIVNGSWFQPDAWRERQKMLRPVLLASGKSNRLRDHVRVRLQEIYRAFVFGQYMACVALSRTLVEFVINQQAGKLEIETKADGKWEKTLGQLINELEGKEPELARYAETVRSLGNVVIHPKKRDVVAIPKIIESQALACVNSTLALVERLYGEEG